MTITESAAGKTEVVEGGAGDSYTVGLDTQPTVDVAVMLNVPGPQLLATPTLLTFTPANWDVAQTINVMALNDGVGQGLHLATITHAASSSDASYNGAAVEGVIVSITDNQQSIDKIAISPSGASVRLSFASLTNRFYRVEYRTDLTSTSWQVLSNNMVGTGFLLQVNDGLAGLPLFEPLIDASR